jgi:hypothetical protein
MGPQCSPMSSATPIARRSGKNRAIANTRRTNSRHRGTLRQHSLGVKKHAAPLRPRVEFDLNIVATRLVPLSMGGRHSDAE